MLVSLLPASYLQPGRQLFGTGNPVFDRIVFAPNGGLAVFLPAPALGVVCLDSFKSVNVAAD